MSIMRTIVTGCLALLCAGCVSVSEQTVSPKRTDNNHEHIVVTEAAEKAFKNQANKKWVITYSGTCSGEPSLGFYQDRGDTAAGSLIIKHGDCTILVEKAVVDAFEKLGDLTIDCVDYNGDSPGGNQFVAEFKVDNDNLSPFYSTEPSPGGG